jgi:hypothetical protein
MADEFITARIQDLIEQYLETRGRRYDYVSVRAAQTALEQIVPSHAIPDRVLDDMIATHAIAHGLCVHFDRVGRDSEPAAA